jgi:hypothetical protein
MAQQLGDRLEQPTALISQSPYRFPHERVMRITFVLATVLIGACGSVASSPDRVHESLRLHSGDMSHFASVSCVVLDATDADAKDIRGYLSDTLRRLHMPLCTSDDAPVVRLHVAYNAGVGVCIDCGQTSAAERSAFALLAVQSGDHEVATAEWQYQDGGSPRQAADQFAATVARLCSREGRGNRHRSVVE